MLKSRDEGELRWAAPRWQQEVGRDWVYRVGLYRPPHIQLASWAICTQDVLLPSSLSNKKPAKGPPTSVGCSGGDAAGAGLARRTLTPAQLPARVHVLHHALPLGASGREASHHSHCSLCGEGKDSGPTSLCWDPRHPSSSLKGTHPLTCQRRRTSQTADVKKETSYRLFDLPFCESHIHILGLFFCSVFFLSFLRALGIDINPYLSYFWHILSPNLFVLQLVCVVSFTPHNVFYVIMFLPWL